MASNPMTIHLETERMILRNFTADDVELLVQLDGDPAVMRYITGGPPTPREVLADDHLPYYLECHEKTPWYGFWVAIERETGDFLGWFHFRPNEDDASDDPELGYRLVQSSWGKGYATEGSRALIDKGFRELPIDRVYATTMTVNTGSRRVMEKAGMRHVRDFVMDWPDVFEGSEFGDVEYAITRAEWEAQESS